MGQCGDELVLAPIGIAQRDFSLAQLRLALLLGGDVANAPDATGVLPVDDLDLREALVHPPVGECQQVEALGRRVGVDLLDARQIGFWVGELPGAYCQRARMLAGRHDLARYAPHLCVLLVEAGYAPIAVGYHDAIEGGLQRGLHHRHRAGELRGALLERVLDRDQLALGTLALLENGPRVLERDRAQQLLLCVVGDHQPVPSFSAARRVPATRALIFANAVALEVDVSSQNGEKPQSSVVPSCSSGIYFAASSTRSRTSSAVSMRASMGSMTPTNTFWCGFM